MLQGVDIKPLLTMKHGLSQIKRSRSSIQAIRHIPIMSKNYKDKLQKNTSRKHNFEAGTEKKTSWCRCVTHTRLPWDSHFAVEHRPFRKHQQPGRKGGAWPSHTGPLLSACKPRSRSGGPTRSKVEAVETDTDGEQL